LKRQKAKAWRFIAHRGRSANWSIYLNNDSIEYMITLSKTDYLIFRECHKNAWLKIHRPEIYHQAGLSEFDMAIIETGNEVETYARQLFPDGVLIEGRDAQAQELTLRQIAQKTPLLFQPVFVKDGFLAALDILQYDPKTNGYALYEVKASNSIKEDTHISDLAFQCAVLEKMNIPVRKAFVIHLNSEYSRAGSLNVEKLFVIDDVTDAVQKIQAHTVAEMEIAQEYLSKENEPAGHCDCIYKGRSRHCTTFKYSNPDVPEYGVHDIARIGVSKAKLADWIDEGIFRLEDLPADAELSPIQFNQVDTYINDGVLINTDKIADELKKMVLPLYFLDYETCPAAIPRFDGFSPYQQIPFQYSLHILDDSNGKLRHEEFLSTTPGDPSAALCASLQKHIGNVGSIVVWSKKFECTINKELGERIPAAKVFLDSLNSRAYDLMDVFSKQHYVHKGFKGGTSIKDVLPVLAPELSYDDLAIKEGGTASQSWDKITSSELEPSVKEIIARDLKLYCERDTYAMYAIWQHLCNV
jgi:hypothetical protein